MTVVLNAKRWPMAIALIGIVGLSACEEGGFGGSAADDAVNLPANAPNQRVRPGQDVERPDLFAVTESGLWDGRPSLGGVWVAHPDAQTPERVLIRNTLNGETIVGALFRRERENPGPLLQISSDAAEALGILPGAPTELNVVALRRAEPAPETEAEAPEANPVVASLEAPVSVAAEALEPVAQTAEVAATAAAEAAPAAVQSAATAVVASELPPAEAASDTIDVSAVLSQPAAPADGPIAQIGIFSVQANADSAVAAITAAGIAARSQPEEIGGRTVWRVLAGPLVDAGVVAQLRGLGYVDAFIVEDGQ